VRSWIQEFMTGKKVIVLEELAIAAFDKSDFKRQVAEIREKKLREEAEFIHKASTPRKNKKGSNPK
jgi:hypothetical protein